MAALNASGGGFSAALACANHLSAASVQRATIGAYTTTGVAIAKTTTATRTRTTVRTTRHMTVTLAQLTQHPT